MRMETAKKLYPMMLTIPYIHLEDIFVAFAVHRLNISIKSLPGFNSAKLWDEKINCDCVILRHYVDPYEIYALWTGSNCQNEAKEHYPCKEFDRQKWLNRLFISFSFIVMIVYFYINYSYINIFSICKLRLNVNS